jgi:hypothetical protein
VNQVCHSSVLTIPKSTAGAIAVVLYGASGFARHKNSTVGNDDNLIYITDGEQSGW